MRKPRYSSVSGDPKDEPLQIVMVEQKIPCTLTDYIVIAAFWIALVLNSTSQGVPNPEENPGRAILEGLASLLYGMNVAFLLFQGIPCVKDSELRGRCCSCSCRAKEYAIASVVFFCFSIGSFIMNVVYLD
jgi:hypothetical protein